MTAIAIAKSERPLPCWQPATWKDYVAQRDDPSNDRLRLFFQQRSLLVLDMGWEGINHAAFCDLFTMLFAFWFSQHPGQSFSSLGRCLLEKPQQRAGAPDLVLYVGEDYPRWEAGEKRRIDLNRWRVPDLIGEIADTTLATDLDEKKQLYAALGIPEYWVVDVRGERIFAFQLQANASYQQCKDSCALAGLPIVLLEQTLAQMQTGTNGSAALWFSRQIAELALAADDSSAEANE